MRLRHLPGHLLGFRLPADPAASRHRLGLAASAGFAAMLPVMGPLTAADEADIAPDSDPAPDPSTVATMPDSAAPTAIALVAPVSTELGVASTEVPRTTGTGTPTDASVASALDPNGSIREARLEPRRATRNRAAEATVGP